MSFENLNLVEPILRALKDEGYTTPTPIQAQAIPLVLERKDLLGVAQTGTGKTAAFSLPIIQILAHNKTFDKSRIVKSLIVTPTRELAIQIGESIRAYGKHTGVKCTVIFGGVNQYSQVLALQKGVDIVIATPGRLLDLMQQRHISLEDIEIFVLDEADRMLDMGFIHDVKKIIAKLPTKRQSLFFSATMPPAITELAGTILTNPVRVEVTPPSSTADKINQVVYFVDRDNKRHLLVELLKDQTIERVLVFTRTKHGADRVAKELVRLGITSLAIHGNKSQNNRQNALKSFKSKETRVLVATDIAARGIDIDELTHVINFELPNEPESYVHRIGRTGRAGASGIAIAFCDAEEKNYLKDIQKLIGKQIPVIDDHAFPLMDHNPKKTSKENFQPRTPVARNSNNPQGRSERNFGNRSNPQGGQGKDEGSRSRFSKPRSGK